MAIDLQKILEKIKQSEPQQKLPPVHLWQPDIVGEMDLVIDKHQHWFHEGEAFQRESLVKLLSSVIRCDEGEYFLVTPSEKMKIMVEDVPFSIVSLITHEDNSARFSLLTNTEQMIALDAHCHWQLREFEGLLLPYIQVRDGLWARINRPVYYQLIELAQLNQSQTEMFIFSDDCEFSLGSISEE